MIVVVLLLAIIARSNCPNFLPYRRLSFRGRAKV